MANTQFLFKDDIVYGTINVYVKVGDEIAKSMVMGTNAPGSINEPLMTISREEAQEIVNRLGNLGITYAPLRPAAEEAHFKDFKMIAMGLLECLKGMCAKQ